MTTLFIIMMTLTLIVPLFIVPLIDSHWMVYEILAKEGDQENMHVLLKQINSWIIRHLACALIAVIFIAVLVYSPYLLGQPDQLATITGIYAIISIIFAFIEMLLAQEISHMTATGKITENREIGHAHLGSSKNKS